MTHAEALAELLAVIADPAILRVVHPDHNTPDRLVPAAFAIEHNTPLALALSDLFGDGLVVVEHHGNPLALHAACGMKFFDSYDLHTAEGLIAEWADFYQEPVSNFSLRPSNAGDREALEIDLAEGERAADLRDALLERCGAAIAVLRG